MCCLQERHFRRGWGGAAFFFFPKKPFLVFLYNLYILVWIQHGCLATKVLAVDPSNSVIDIVVY